MIGIASCRKPSRRPLPLLLERSRPRLLLLLPLLLSPLVSCSAPALVDNATNLPLLVDLTIDSDTLFVCLRFHLSLTICADKAAEGEEDAQEQELDRKVSPRSLLMRTWLVLVCESLCFPRGPRLPGCALAIRVLIFGCACVVSVRATW